MDGLVQQLQTKLAQLGISATTRVLLAVSGGIDSMALLDLMQQLPKAKRPTLMVSHINHELRAASKSEEQALRQYCATHQLPLTVTHWPVTQHPIHGIEAAARDFRYATFKKQMVSERASVLMTAHQANDQAETIIMKLIRGGDVAQLTGMAVDRPFHDGRLMRPLLGISRSQIEAYATERHLMWFNDATNDNDDVLRNRIRHHLLPQMAAENPQIMNQLANYGEQIGQLLDNQHAYASQLADEVYDFAANVGQLKKFMTISEKMQSAVLEAIVQRVLPGITPLTSIQLAELANGLGQSSRPNATIPITSGMVMVRQYDTFKIRKAELPRNFSVNSKTFMLEFNQWIFVNDKQRVGLFEQHHTQNFDDDMRLQLPVTEYPLTVRPASPSDQLRLANGHHKTVRRIFIDRKIPSDARLKARVVVSQSGQVLWLIGIQKAQLTANVTAAKSYQLILKATVAEGNLNE